MKNREQSPSESEATAEFDEEETALDRSRVTEHLAEEIKAELEQQPDELGEYATEAGLSDEETREVFEQNRFIEQLERFQRQIEELRQKAKLAGRLAVLGISLMGAPEALAQKPQVHPPSPEKSRVERKAEITHPPLTWQDLQKMALFEKNERTIFSDESLLAPDSQTTGSEIMVGFNTEVLDAEVSRGEVKNLVFGHTHTLEAYKMFGYSDEEIEQIRSGQAEPPLSIPPSTYDIYQNYLRERDYSAQGADVREFIIGTNGIWEYSSRQSKDIEKYTANFDTMATEAIALTESLPPNLKNEVIELFRTKDSQDVLDYAKSSQEPELRQYGYDFEVLIEKQGGKVLERMGKYIQLRSDLTAERDSAERDKILGKFLKHCKKMGIDMKFTPYEKLENP